MFYTVFLIFLTFVTFMFHIVKEILTFQNDNPSKHDWSFKIYIFLLIKGKSYSKLPGPVWKSNC